MAADLDGPRLEPRAGGAARQLVVFLHGYGADGKDLIEIGRAWQALLPHCAFVSPHAPEPCGQAPVGRISTGGSFPQHELKPNLQRVDGRLEREQFQAPGGLSC